MSDKKFIASALSSDFEFDIVAVEHKIPVSEYAQDDAAVALLMKNPQPLMDLLATTEPLTGTLRQFLINILSKENDYGVRLTVVGNGGKEGNHSTYAKDITRIENYRKAGVRVLKYMVEGNALEFSIKYVAKDLTTEKREDAKDPNAKAIKPSWVKNAYSVYVNELRARNLYDETVAEIETIIEQD